MKYTGTVENYFLQAILYFGKIIEKGFWLCELQIVMVFHLIFMIIHLYKLWVGLNFPHCP